MTGASHARFDPDVLRDEAGDKVYARGEAYHRDGLVRLLLVEPNRVAAEVEGTENYRTELTDADGEIGGSCTCPAFENWGMCKHMVATALAANAAGSAGEGLNPCEAGADPAGARSRIRDHLMGRGAEALADLLLRLADKDSDLFRRLDVAAAAALGDDATLERRLRKALDDTTRTGRFVDYRAAAGWAAGVDEILDVLGETLTAGHAQLVLALSLRAIDRIESAIEAIDDSDGYCTGLLERAADLLFEATGVVRPEPVQLARDLFEREMADEWGTFRAVARHYADLLGKKGCAEYRRLAAAAWDELPARTARPGAGFDYDPVYERLKDILCFFAERDGDVAAGIALRAKDLSSPYNYLELAKFCLDAGQPDEALRHAQEGLWVFEDDRPDERLVDLAADLLARDGRADEAITLYRRAFEKVPGIGIYRRLGELGGEAERKWAVSQLEARLGGETRRSWETPAGLLVAIHQEERAFDAAWKIVRTHGASIGVADALARASEASHPAEAIEVYARQVEQLAGVGGKPAYEKAAQLVQRIGRLQGASEQAAYVAGLKTRFERKRNFMKLLG